MRWMGRQTSGEEALRRGGSQIPSSCAKEARNGSVRSCVSTDFAGRTVMNDPQIAQITQMRRAGVVVHRLHRLHRWGEQVSWSTDYTDYADGGGVVVHSRHDFRGSL